MPIRQIPYVWNHLWVLDFTGTWKYKCTDNREAIVKLSGRTNRTNERKKDEVSGCAE